MPGLGNQIYDIESCQPFGLSSRSGTASLLPNLIDACESQCQPHSLEKGSKYQEAWFLQRPSLETSCHFIQGPLMVSQPGAMKMIVTGNKLE